MATSSESAGTTRAVWKIDPVHTIVEFAGRHMMVTTVKGRFKSLRGTIWMDEADPARSSVEAEIDATSLDTGSDQRDQHLRSADFLEVDTFPKISFKSTRIEALGHNHGRVTGDLTVHGVTREVVLDAQYTGSWKNPRGVVVAGFEATATLNRKDFGLTWNVALEAGGLLVSDTLKVEIQVEAVRQP